MIPIQPFLHFAHSKHQLGLLPTVILRTVYRLLPTAHCLLPTACCLLLLSSCSPKFDPKQTYTVEQLRADYDLVRGALEEAHPGLYRYTSRDSMNLIFDQTARELNRPMTEREFRKVLIHVFDYVRCGHTDIYPSKGYTKYFKKNKPKEFPLSVFIDNNRPYVIQNRSTDTTLKIGMELTAIDNLPVQDLLSQMRQLVPSDGYNQTFKNSVVNSSFGSFYRFLYGNNDTLKITLKDSTGKVLERTLTYNKPTKTTKKTAPKPPTTPTPKPVTPPVSAPKPTPKPAATNKKRTFGLSPKDSTVGVLSVKTFSDNQYHRFYRKTFKKIKNQQIKHLVIDIRANGGGRSDASINLMSYLLDSAYVVYDTIDGQARRP
nr:S41 family peptidase [Spirosomataceae bacterium]